VSMEQAKLLAIAECNRLMKLYGIKRPYSRRKRKAEPSRRLFGVYCLQQRLSWYWRANWFVGGRLFAVQYSEEAYPAGVARQKAIAARLAAEAKYPI
jgi:hypothetical protein